MVLGSSHAKLPLTPAAMTVPAAAVCGMMAART
jgi:hypothetical protein